MEINDMKQMCTPAAKPRLALPITAATGVVVAWTGGATVQKHAAFGARGTTGLPAWSPPTC